MRIVGRPPSLPSPPWSWPAFAIGACAGLLLAVVLWFVLRLLLVVAVSGVVVAIAVAWLAGNGTLRQLVAGRRAPG